MNLTEQRMEVCNPLWQLSRFITASGMQYHNQALLHTHSHIGQNCMEMGFKYFHDVWCPLTWCVWVEHALGMRDTCTTVEPYALDGKVCMIDWNCDLRVKVKVRVGKWGLNVPFFLYFEKWRKLCGDATWPTPSVGHVTRDMKRRESNETLWRREVGSILSYRIELSSLNVPSSVTESSMLVSVLELSLFRNHSFTPELFSWAGAFSERIEHFEAVV